MHVTSKILADLLTLAAALLLAAWDTMVNGKNAAQQTGEDL